ncbi:MAG: penicillin binding protein transpeptidase domain-containing protein [Rickettsiales bacterium]|nr:MAG: penicillin binding protein transpeptidase domain-containing protein [Rickettsiales bacterium]
MTKKIMFVEDLQNGWKLYGKMGNGSQLSCDRSRKLNKQVGWFVGFIQKNDQSIAFAYLIADDSPEKSYASLRAKAAAKEKLIAMTNYPKSHSFSLLVGNGS